MQWWQGVGDVPGDWPASVVTMGVFDGVHRGHRALVSRAVDQARDVRLPAVVVTFDPHPVAVLKPGSEPARLCSLEHRVQLLAQLGIDGVCVLSFTAERAGQSAEDFVREVLVDTVHAAAVVVGEGFRFGHRAAGDVPLLARLGGVHGFSVEGAPLFADAGHPISSTWVRERVAEGDVAAAADALGRPHRIEGTVVRGDRRGRELGYPTANVAVDSGSAVPPDGVYAGWLVVAGESLPAAISLGTNPTFGGVERRVEAYALDRDDLDLYDARVAVDFAARLRDTERFNSVDALIAQMAHDVALTRKLTAS
ncbi:MAG: bifunctional riboflavin kinase/FAD synthetase [Actinomycetota bacterium]|jgi:riboflavin kinase/FMN adenylyltransferase|nr:bifunctional riboflavin kinase/FAD synthetase [Acidothermales bacterium]MDQ3431681.1 bifunctional riboflavin kinase/FAD synthetase [Actinomycetota bacterium]